MTGRKLLTLKPGVRALDLRNVQPASGSLTERLRGSGRMTRNERVLRLYPICALCEPKGLVSPSTQVDHRLPLICGGTEDESNLWGLCDPCHQWKTGAEATRRAQGVIDLLPGLPPIKSRPELVIE